MLGFTTGRQAGHPVHLGGGSEAHRRARRRRNDEQWQEVASKVEAKVRRKLRAWAEAEPDEDWDEVEQRVGEKLKRNPRILHGRERGLRQSAGEGRDDPGRHMAWLGMLADEFDGD